MPNIKVNQEAHELLKEKSDKLGMPLNAYVVHLSEVNDIRKEFGAMLAVAVGNMDSGDTVAVKKPKKDSYMNSFESFMEHLSEKSEDSQVWKSVFKYAKPEPYGNGDIELEVEYTKGVSIEVVLQNITYRSTTNFEDEEKAIEVLEKIYNGLKSKKYKLIEEIKPA